MGRPCGDDCGEQHCAVCDRRHLRVDELQTCPWCVGRVRADLAAVVQLAELLHDQAVHGGGVSFDPIGRGGSETSIPGGDAVVLLAGGSDGMSAVRAIMAGGSGDWADDERSSDPVPVVWALARVEDDWRRQLGFYAAAVTTLEASSSFLDSQMTWAAQHHPGFPDHAAELHALCVRLEQVVQAGDRALVGMVPCFDCGGDLSRAYAPPRPCPHVPAPRHTPAQEPPAGSGWGWRTPWTARPLRTAPCGCDQGGLATHWRCRTCGRSYSDPEYWLALRARLEEGRTAS